jgi:uncharacterized protein
VSEKLPSRTKAITFLIEFGCSIQVIDHCKAVSDLALKTAQNIQDRGITVNMPLVEIGGLLHDIGRSKTHKVDHAIIGAKIAKQVGLPESIISIIKRHVGGGITSSEAKKLGWVDDIYMPLTLEEKIVTYADNLIKKSKTVSVEITIKKLNKEKKLEAAERVRKLDEEISKLAGVSY